ncbi:NR0B1 [Branchiostoma lanceolatum]|uniref:NR0B1 protein n=2 Tax=Branchiostoma lanceolatum TaxID=7740 RepID=A0A8J9ZH49_BRALA|nr:NR0B1 [Branchiostoma lanceolatum]
MQMRVMVKNQLQRSASDQQTATYMKMAYSKKDLCCQCVPTKATNTMLYSLLMDPQRRPSSTGSSCCHSNTESESDPQQGVLDLSMRNSQKSSRSSSEDGEKAVTVLHRLAPEHYAMIHHAASQVLIQTIDFMRKLPAFTYLPPNDQMLLLMRSWHEIVAIGVAQEKVPIDTVSVPAPPCECCTGAEMHWGGTPPPTLTMPGCILSSDLDDIQQFVMKYQSLDLDCKEAAYLKAAVLFTPVPGLAHPHYIEALQKEAQQALNEYTMMTRPLETLRFARILLMVPLLRGIKQEPITELFFRPLIANVRMEDVLRQMLFT